MGRKAEKASEPFFLLCVSIPKGLKLFTNPGCALTKKNSAARRHSIRSARNVRYRRLEGSEKEELASRDLARDGHVAHAPRSVGELDGLVAVRYKLGLRLLAQRM